MLLSVSNLAEGITMRTVLFLNRWNDLFQLMLTKVDGEQSRRLESRFCHTLEQARKLMAYWRAEYDVAEDDVHDIYPPHSLCLHLTDPLASPILAIFQSARNSFHAAQEVPGRAVGGLEDHRAI